MNNERKKLCKIGSSNKDEDILEEQDKNKTQEPVATKRVTAEASLDVRKMVE